MFYLAAGRNISEREADIPEILIILFVALDIFPLADGLGQVHHAQRDLDLQTDSNSSRQSYRGEGGTSYSVSTISSLRSCPYQAEIIFYAGNNEAGPSPRGPIKHFNCPLNLLQPRGEND